MLFNSYEFILFFLPITAVIYFSLTRFEFPRVALYWMTLCSLVFYGYWNPPYIILLIISILGNFYIGQLIDRSKDIGKDKQSLLLGIIFNLAILGYYKYAGFFISTVNSFFDLEINVPEILLPLGISFYSFTQIAYLVDVYKLEKGSCRYNLIDYTLFVSFFPQLIAGPILRHNELIPEFKISDNFAINHRNIALGITIFVIGLGKKVLIADNIAAWANEVFANAVNVTFLEAWIGALSYTFQLYFDFSGYSDMAIGLGLMFNFHLPLNFNSPYKATSIVDFWRRWHITLSNFLRDYLYIPLGGSRRGEIRRYFNLIVTMLLGGLWHGAGWTFVIWGGLHGLYLSINHGWRKLGYTISPMLAWVITFIAVVVSWVVFRASVLSDASSILQSMIGMNGIVLPDDLQNTVPWLGSLGITFSTLDHLPSNYFRSLLVLIILTISVVLLPNTNELAERFKPSWLWTFSIGFLAALCLVSLNQVSEFLYFQF